MEFGILVRLELTERVELARLKPENLVPSSILLNHYFCCHSLNFTLHTFGVIIFQKKKMDVTAILPSPLPCPPLTMGQKSKLFSVIYRISISWCLSHSLSSSLGTPGFHFALHPYTYCVLPCLIYLCMPLFFMGKASLSFKLGCLDKYHSSLKI